MLILLTISIVSLILPLIFRRNYYVRFGGIIVISLVLILFFMYVQMSSATAGAKKSHELHGIPSEEWLEGADQTRLIATEWFSVAGVCCIALIIFAVMPLITKEESVRHNDDS